MLVQQMEVLEQRIEDRRNAFDGPVMAADRIALERFVVGSVLDIVRTRSPMITPCQEEPLELCVPMRTRSFRRAPERRVLVCVDEQKSCFTYSELGVLPIQSVASVEGYSGVYADEVRVYTDRWTMIRTRIGRTSLVPSVGGLATACDLGGAPRSLRPATLRSTPTPRRSGQRGPRRGA